MIIFKIIVSRELWNSLCIYKIISSCHYFYRSRYFFNNQEYDDSENKYKVLVLKQFLIKLDRVIKMKGVLYVYVGDPYSTNYSRKDSRNLPLIVHRARQRPRHRRRYRGDITSDTSSAGS